MSKSYLRLIALAPLVTACVLPVLAFGQDLTAKTAVSEVTPQRVTTARTMRSIMPLNPQFMVNMRQADLRDHHLVKAPIPRAALLVEPEPQAIDKGPATSVLPPGAGADSPVVIIKNRGLNDTETGGITSTVNEPSVAASKDGVVLYTANWFAAISKDDGESFSYLNPAQSFPETDNQPFCCDQVALYDPANDLMFWFLQYVQNGSANKIRLAYARGEDIRNENWSYYDFTPQNIGGWNNEWFDYPDLGLSKNHLYISINSFSTQGTPSTQDDQFARAVIIRLPLEQIAQNQPVTVQYFDSQEAFSFRPTQGAQEVMYFGSHDFARFGSGIQVYSWPEDSNQLSLRSINVAPWSNANRTSVAADGNQWLRRADFRMTAAWVQGQEAGFAWTAAQDNDFPQPHVRAVIVDMADTGDAPIAQPHLWNDLHAFAYPFAAVNGEGTVGVTVAYGGGGQAGINPSHAVGVLRKTDAGYRWQLAATDNGSNGPADGRWGDYLSLKPHGKDPRLWVASGYTLRGGPLPGDVVPRVAYFQEPGAEPIVDSARKVLKELQGDVENIRNQVDQLLQKIQDLQSRVEELQQ